MEGNSGRQYRDWQSPHCDPRCVRGVYQAAEGSVGGCKATGGEFRKDSRRFAPAFINSLQISKLNSRHVRSFHAAPIAPWRRDRGPTCEEFCARYGRERDSRDPDTKVAMRGVTGGRRILTLSGAVALGGKEHHHPRRDSDQAEPYPALRGRRAGRGLTRGRIRGRPRNRSATPAAAERVSQARTSSPVTQALKLAVDSGCPYRGNRDSVVVVVAADSKAGMARRLDIGRMYVVVK